MQGPATLGGLTVSKLVSRAERGAELLVATLLVGNTLLIGSLTSREPPLNRLHDEEEDGSCDRHDWINR